MSVAVFVLKMRPHPEGRSSLKYPVSGLLQVKGIVKEDEIHHPTPLGANGEVCLIVIKNGRSTGVTIGRGTSTESFVREYDGHVYCTNVHMMSGLIILCPALPCVVQSKPS
jgi:hypothetical protein